MPGDSVPDEAARLEAALERISRAAAQAKSVPPPPAHDAALHDASVQVTTPAFLPHSAEIAARLDGLIAELRGVLGTDV
jgi:hypothetical protein